MAITYRKLNDLLDLKGYSYSSLKKLGVITDFASRQLYAGEPVNLKHLESICLFFDVPIEAIVEVIPDEAD